MSTRPVVFVGPSLDVRQAQVALDTEYLPPVRRGDLDALLSRDTRPDAVGIIDGVFFQGLAVTPKEILRMLDSGVRLFGSSSMGALRAAECATYGMVGVGRVFAAYHSGAVDSDDEVAMIFNPEDHHAMSEPLINLRFAVSDAVESGHVDSETAEAFMGIAKQLYFPDRTAKHVLRLLTGKVGARQHVALEDYLLHRAVDTKRDDALALLHAIHQVSVTR